MSRDEKTKPTWQELHDSLSDLLNETSYRNDMGRPSPGSAGIFERANQLLDACVERVSPTAESVEPSKPSAPQAPPQAAPTLVEQYVYECECTSKVPWKKCQIHGAPCLGVRGVALQAEAPTSTQPKQTPCSHGVLPEWCDSCAHTFHGCLISDMMAWIDALGEKTETIYGGSKLHARHDPRCGVYLQQPCNCGLVGEAEARRGCPRPESEVNVDHSNCPDCHGTGLEAEAPRGDQPTKEMSQNEHNREMDSHVNDPGVVTSGLYAGETRADGEGCREFMQSEFLAALSVKAPGVAFAGDVRQYVDAVIYNHIEDRLNAVLPDSLNRSMEDRIELLLERADREASLAVKLRNQLESNSAPSNIEQDVRQYFRDKVYDLRTMPQTFNELVEIMAAYVRHMLSKEK